MTKDNIQPISDRHITFARALVALAREHGANSLEVKFSLTGTTLWPPGSDCGWDDVRVTFQWSEGRHGSLSRFALRAESFISILEKEEAK